MSIYETPNGTWRVKWRDVNGTQQSKTHKTQARAVRHAAQVRTDTDRGLPTAPRKRITLARQADLWLAGAHNLSPRSLAIYREALAHILPVLGDRPLHAVDADAINAYLAGRRGLAAPSTIHREYRTLRRLLKVAVGQGRIPASPITRDSVPAPQVPHEEMRFLTAHQLEDLAATIDPRYRTLILVAGWGGLRWGELAGLRGREVDVLGHRVRVTGQLSTDGRTWKPETKTRQRRWVSLPASVVGELEVTDGYMWTHADGGPLTHARFRQRYFVPAAIRASLAVWSTDRISRSAHYEGLRIHDLRHTAAALAIAGKADPKEIQAMLGHTSIATTYDRYGHLFPDAQTDLASRLDAMRKLGKAQRTGKGRYKAVPENSDGSTEVEPSAHLAFVQEGGGDHAPQVAE